MHRKQKQLNALHISLRLPVFSVSPARGSARPQWVLSRFAPRTRTCALPTRSQTRCEFSSSDYSITTSMQNQNKENETVAAGDGDTWRETWEKSGYIRDCAAFQSAPARAGCASAEPAQASSGRPSRASGTFRRSPCGRAAPAPPIQNCYTWRKTRGSVANLRVYWAVLSSSWCFPRDWRSPSSVFSEEKLALRRIVARKTVWFSRRSPDAPISRDFVLAFFFWRGGLRLPSFLIWARLDGPRDCHGARPFSARALFG